MITIEHRFHGPPDSGNGGYTCGLVAAHVDGPSVVTLRRPPPLDTPLQVERGDEGSVRVLDGDTLVAEAQPGTAVLDVDVPEAVSFDDARAAGAASQWRRHPERHPFPTCFVCGPHRTPDDGLCITVGLVAGRGLGADTWTPHASLVGDDGVVRPEFVWAALDCSGGLGAMVDREQSDSPYVLGRFSANTVAPVRAGEPYVVVGWRIGEDGRKLFAGSALLDAEGAVAGVGHATWIRMQAPPGT